MATLVGCIKGHYFVKIQKFYLLSMQSHLSSFNMCEVPDLKLELENRVMREAWILAVESKVFF